MHDREEFDKSTTFCCEHSAHFYSSSPSLLGHLTPRVAAALNDGHGVIVAALGVHIDELLRRLTKDGQEVTQRIDSRQLVCVDAELTLSRLMTGRQPDRASFDSLVNPLVDEAKSRFGDVFVYGEMVSLLWQQNNHEAADLLEQWWNDLVRRCDFTLMCGYQADLLCCHDGMVEHLESVCRTHTTVGSCEKNGRRMEAAIDSALEQALPGSDIEALRQALKDGAPTGLEIPAHAVLVGLHRLLPWLAEDVRVLARDHYLR